MAEAIALERKALETLAAIGHHIDTSYLRANALRAFVKDFVALDERHGLTLLFESFGFKHGIPLDADLVFDVRCLPNPHYDPALLLNGQAMTLYLWWSQFQQTISCAPIKLLPIAASIYLHQML